MQAASIATCDRLNGKVGQNYRPATGMTVTVQLMKGLCPVETVYHWIYCEHCDVRLHFEAHIEPGFAEREEVRCPYCKQSLGRIRADFGYTFISSEPGKRSGADSSDQRWLKGSSGQRTD